jgi:electron transfer flavoprotein alpha subunit
MLRVVSTARSLSQPAAGWRRFATTLIVGDQQNVAAAVTAALQWTPTNELHWLTTTTPASPQGVPAAISKVFVTNSPLAEVLAEAAVELYSSSSSPYDRLLGCHDKQGSTVLPRIAGMIKAPCVADVIAFQENGSIVVRPIYAGNGLVTVKISPRTILSIRPTAFAAAAAVSATSDDKEAKNVEIVAMTTAATYKKSTWISAWTGGASSARPDLPAAATVVSGGRALGSAGNFARLLEPLADAIGNAAVGASRAAVDAGMYPNAAQVGQTGKVVAPDLYIAAGISGAIQHVSGMKDSKVIVAINKDPDAPIYQIADYGLVADLFQVVPELTDKIKQQQQQ